MARRPRNMKAKRQAGSARERANRTILSRTLILMILCGVVLFIPLIATLYQLMIRDHDKYEEMAIRNQTRSTSLTASRGVVYDRNMNILASSATVETIFLDPNAIQTAQKAEEEKRLAGKQYNACRSVDFIARGLSEILDVDAEFVREQAADTAYYYKVVKRKVPEETAQEVRKFINDNDLTGLVNLEMDSQRYYPYGSLAGQILGFVRSDNVGAEGLEAYYDATLTGNAGAIITTKGNHGTEMLYTYEKYYDASDGNSLVLTLDVTAQYYLEKNLEEAMERYDVLNGACGLVMDVNTGEILAMATLGGYDPNNYQEIYDDELRQELDRQYQEALRLDEKSQAYTDAIAAYNAAMATARLRQWRNRCVSDGYEPGSTFKLITLSSALDSGAVTENTTFVCNGTGHKFANRDQPVDCWKLIGHGQETTMEALGNSCNPAFATMGVYMGDETFYQYIKNFGFLELTGVDLPGEAKGVFFSHDDFCGVSQASMISTTFGQTFRITPIQLARAVAAVVNGGYLLEPYIVKEVQDADGNVVQKNETTVLRQVISEETSAAMRTMMEYVVTDGTASKAKVPGYRVGGKTGTSEKMDVYDEFGKLVDDKICSFVGVAPINDPKYVVLVVLDTPNKQTNTGLIGGGAMAAPTVGTIMADILPYLGIEPDYSDADLNLITLSMPDLAGMTEAEAAEILSEKSFTYRKVGEGAVVMDQIPAAGAMIPGKSQVVLYFNQDAPDDLVEVPDFMGMTMFNANYLATNGGVYMLVTGANKDDMYTTVTYQNPAAGTMVPRGTTVTVEFTDHSAGD